MKLYQQKNEKVNFIITVRHHLIRPLLKLQRGSFCLLLLRKLLKGINEKALFVLRLGLSVTIILVKLSAVVSQIAITTWQIVQFKEENSTYYNCMSCRNFPFGETFHSE